MVLRYLPLVILGLAWELASREWSTLAVVDERLDPAVSDANVLGGSAHRTTHLRATVPGSDTIVAQLARPWEEQPAERATFHVEVAGAPTGGAPHGLLEAQQRRLAQVA